MTFEATWVVRSTLSIVATVAVWGFVATPLPAQTTTPATQPASTIEGAYEKLNSPLPADRNNARVELMGLHRNDLPTLKRVVESRLPVYPQQAVDLRDIVRHVYLAADVYPSSAEGFLGVATRGGQSSVVLQMPDGTAGGGVDLSEIYVGFAAYRWLQQGDVILSVGHANDETPVRVGATLTAAVKKIPPGDEVDRKSVV